MKFMLNHEQEVWEKYIISICEVLMKYGGLSSADFKIRKPGIKNDASGFKSMVEVESKYEVADRKALQKIIMNHGFELVDEVFQHDNYGDKARQLRDRKQVVRTRRVFDGGYHFQSGEIKWEGPSGNILDRPVVEVKILNSADIDVVETLLKKRLGIEIFASFVKHRWHYKKNTTQGVFEIELDFFEDEQNPEKIRDKIYAQVAMEVKPEKRDTAVELVKSMATELDLIYADNRDYIDIAEIK